MFAGALLMYFAAQQTTFAGFFPLLAGLLSNLYADHCAD
ncbi:major facilitator superfamily protein [Escherichia coli]|uniref:Major facilitator superfamily protein n=1 Tax=Escherichia coli TaxID=562 RepID=A0A376U704_ECOLX|nr:major facilitator superfamily protein [Escherichia coli]